MDQFGVDDDPALLYICSPPRVTEWTFEENKLFESCLAEFNTNSPDLLDKISERISGKTRGEIKEHYDALVEDIKKIELGLVPLPDYNTLKNDRESAMQANSSNALRRKRGIPWTEEEHEKFIEGLKKYGKGDWRSISRYCVKTRNPTQVASHAQKHFIRLEKGKGVSRKNNFIKGVE